jgi:hypothetical protein
VNYFLFSFIQRISKENFPIIQQVKSLKVRRIIFIKNLYMSTTNLKNFTINEKLTISGETYFIIKDNEQNTAYFCFENQLKDN